MEAFYDRCIHAWKLAPERCQQIWLDEGIIRAAAPPAAPVPVQVIPPAPLIYVVPTDGTGGQPADPVEAAYNKLMIDIITGD